MSLARNVWITAILLAAVVSSANAAGIKTETVPGGALAQTWLPAFGVGRTFTPLTLTGADPAIPNPSGDNTVAVLQNVDINSGGIAACATSEANESSRPRKHGQVWTSTVQVKGAATGQRCARAT